jgi:hypothetical protein
MSENGLRKLFRINEIKIIMSVNKGNNKITELRTDVLLSTFKVQGHYSSISRMSTMGINNSLTAPAH